MKEKSPALVRYLELERAANKAGGLSILDHILDEMDTLWQGLTGEEKHWLNTRGLQAFDIGIFPGDPNRGGDHDGWMYSIRIGKQYYKSTDVAGGLAGPTAFSEPEDAARAAAEHAVRLMTMVEDTDADR